MLIMYVIAFVGYLLTGKIQYAKAVIEGILWNIVHLKEIIQKRKHVQQHIRVVSDDSFIPRLTRSVSFNYYYYQFFGGIEKYNE